ncbi:MAG: His/Gly/Thr/Pro-type tRNA ligase C-terminal domain-containing protein, partial [Clostridia bacterium]
LVWPMSIAPWQVCICPLRLDNENVKNISEKLYDDFTQSGIEVIYDDRDISAGIKFADSELMGIPLRVVISPRSLEKNQVELSYRKSGEKEMVDLPQIIAKIKQIII